MNRELDFLTLEVGSTITRANGFVKAGNALKHAVQSFVPTTSALGNVGIGLFAAIDEIEKKGYNVDKAEVFASSSAGGAMKVTIHGVNQECIDNILPIVCSSGAVVCKATIGAISEYDLEEIEEISPDAILLVGSNEFAYRDIISENAIKLGSLELHFPIVFYGNGALKVLLEKIFSKSGLNFISVTFDNPNDNLKEKLHSELLALFNSFVVKTAGIDRLKAISNNGVYSENIALSNISDLFAQSLEKDISVIDIGSTFSSVFSKNKLSSIYGDLGIFLSAPPLAASLNDKTIIEKLNNVIAVPQQAEQIEIASILRNKALEIIKKRYIDTGNTFNQIIIGTGGAMSRVSNAELSVKNIYPEVSLVLIDDEYILSAFGLIGTKFPELIKATLKKWAEDHDKYSKIRDLHFANC